MIEPTTECSETETRAAESGADRVRRVRARAGHMLGLGAEAWSPEQVLAWEGLLELARSLRRDAELELDGFDGISVSMLGATGRLALAVDGRLHQTELATAMGLSLSRVSRVVDVLERRGLAERRACPADARATHVVLTPRGAELTVQAQHRLAGFVAERFVDRLSVEEAATLARVFERLLEASPEVTAGPGDGETSPSD